MNNPEKIKIPFLQVERYVWSSAVIWTIIVATSLIWHSFHTRKEALELAQIQARTAYEKDVTYRRWNAGHGGVYVPVTEKTQPNPHLSDVPERDITMPSGKVLTLMNPAYMTRQAHELEKQKLGVRGHITSLNPIRPENAPDPWETEALQAFYRGETEISSVKEIEGKKYIRLMRPLITEKGCLKCHAKQGYHEGDIRGGISVSIPMEPFLAFERSHILTFAWVYGLFWMVGLSGIILGTKRLIRTERERKRAEEALLKSHDELERKVEARTAELSKANLLLKQEITEHKLAGEQLRINESRLEALLKLNYMTKSPFQEISDFALEEAIRLTGSKIGYLAFMNEDETVLTMHAWSKHAMEECRIQNRPIIYPVKTTGLWGEAVRQRKPIITNDYSLPNPWKKGYPEGHVQVTRHMNVPIFDGDRIVLVAGVGNKPTDYEESDILQLTLFMAGMWQIIKRKWAEEELQKLNVELEQRVIERTAQLEDTNKELESFSYSVSHDLRTPLRAIDGFSSMMLEDHIDKLDDEGKRLLNIIRGNTKKMGELIDDLLSLSRIGRKDIELSDIDMNKLAKAVFDEIKTTTHERELQFNIKPLPPARGDEGMIRQVFFNLLYNAIKFTKPKDTAIIEIGGCVEGFENVYYVKDSGVGFDMQHADKLFDAFQRLHSGEEFEGTGVGLSIVQRIIHRHGGRVWAEGKVNEGATFYFALPKRSSKN